MTKLTKPIRRRTIEPLSHAIRPLVITLVPGDQDTPAGILYLRERGRRREYALDIATLYLQAVKADAAARRRQRRKR